MALDIILYTKEGCGLCEEAKELLHEIGQTIPLHIHEIDIRSEPALEAAFRERIPVVDVGKVRLEAPFDAQKLRQAIHDAQHSQGKKTLQKETNTKSSGLPRPVAVGLNKGLLSIARHWAAYLTALILLYVGLPFAAPVAMEYGAPKAAQVIYTVYSPVCHQFAFRSWFLFGDQAVYPRERAATNQGSFEDYAGAEPFFASIDDLGTLGVQMTYAAKDFIGSERMGWKVALCQRDVAIYGSLALFGIVFIVLKRFGIKVPYLPFWAYVLIALVPIGLDGGSQLLANPPFNGFGLALYPIRESTPFLRTLTGTLFGIGNAWLAYPYIEESMDETRIALENKLAQAGLIGQPSDASAD